MEKQVEKVFVKINQSWIKGEVVSRDGTKLEVKTSESNQFKVDESSPNVELYKLPYQKFAYGDAKEKLEGAYISFDKLPPNKQDAIVKGQEIIFQSSYVNEGEMKETVKAVQVLYDWQYGSKLDVQIKRNEPVRLAEAKAYNHQFTKAEFNAMKIDGKHIVFEGVSNQGEVFNKIAYYEPLLNDIRTKPALSENNYFYGQKLTKEQAQAMNNGLETVIKNKEKTYAVKFNPKSESYNSKNIDTEKAKELKVTLSKVMKDLKKKSVNNAMSQ